MAFIYKITNKINGKVYIGKTEGSVEKRFKQHLRDSGKERCKDRPLYRAIRKYGEENFEVVQVEETDDATAREVFWIEGCESYSSGYNATRGGDGKKYIDYDALLLFYRKHSSNKPVKEIAKLFGIDYGYCCKYLNSLGIDINSNTNRFAKLPVVLVDTGEVFESLSEAAKYVKCELPVQSNIRQVVSKISLAARGLRKSAFGFRWQLLERKQIPLD